MRELSHQISVCAAAWPGGQQDGREQPLATDILWTLEARKRGGYVRGRWRETEQWKKLKSAVSKSLEAQMMAKDGEKGPSYRSRGRRGERGWTQEEQIQREGLQRPKLMKVEDDKLDKK